MAQIKQFKEIDDYIKTVELNIESKLPDFMVVNFEHVHFGNHHQLSAYRQSFFEINLELTQGCSIKVDQFSLPSADNRITLVSPHRLQSVQAHKASDEPYKGYGLFFKPEFISSDSVNRQLTKDFPFFSHLNSPTISLKPAEMAYFMDIMNKIQYEYDNYGTFSKDIIRSYLTILFLKAKENYINTANQVLAISREQEIYSEFELLVQKHFLEYTSVKEYADKMHITAKHLSETVKKVSGQSALQIIHKAQLNYAKALLHHTNKTVSEIAYELNFENPDYFSVFFKRLTGKSPVQFRIS